MRCGMQRKCPLFECCQLRIFYAALKQDKTWERRYCRSKFTQCTKYKLESTVGHGIPAVPKELRERVKKR
jgi:hypothetical protein